VTAAVDWRLETRSRSTRPGRAQPASFPPPVRDQLGDQDQVVTTADQGGADVRAGQGRGGCGSRRSQPGECCWSRVRAGRAGDSGLRAVGEGPFVVMADGPGRRQRPVD
jgi:hypothetical protein